MHACTCTWLHAATLIHGCVWRRYQIAKSTMASLVKMKSAVGPGRYYVLGEGNAVAKRHEKARRTAKAEVLMTSKKWKGACTPTDCIVAALRTMIKDHAASGPNEITYVHVPGEAEFQLMYMLRDGHVAHGLLDSSDADAAIIGGDVGTLLLAGEATGRAGGRTVGGFAGPRIIAKTVALEGLWDTVTTGDGKGKTVHDLSSYTFLDRTVLAACVGHDYDSKGAGKIGVTGGAGVSGMALHTAVKRLVAAKAGCPPHGGKDLEHVQALLGHVIKAKRKAEPGDLVRLTLVCFGFYHHPIYNLTTKKAEPYTPVQPATMAWLRQNDEAVANQLADLDAFDPDDECTHVGCKDCGTSTDAVKKYADDNVGHVVANFPAAAAAVAMHTEAQPKLPGDVLNKYLQTTTKLDWYKLKDEALVRAYASAKGLVDNTTITHSQGLNPPEVLIRSLVKQSQDRTPYRPAITLVLNAGKDATILIKQTVCDDHCIKHFGEAICRHRMALLVFLWVNTCKGFAGNPGHRTNYWRVHGSPDAGDAANTVVRANLIHTNRSDQHKVEELEEMERDATASAEEGGSAQRDDGGADEGDEGDGEPAAKRRRRHPANVWVERRARIVGFFSSKVAVDTREKAERLQALAHTHGVPRLFRKHMLLATPATAN